jgi:hypothetical protein
MVQSKAGNSGQRARLKSVGLFIIFTLTAMAAFSQAPPLNQPQQIRSAVIYDEKLKDRFFTKKQWSMGDPNFGEAKTKRLHTAQCVTDHQIRHFVRFCDGQILEDGTLQLYIHDFTPSTVDDLLILVKDEQFTCQYWTVYMGDRGDENLIWTTKKQKLILDKKTYRKGERIKGKIEFECLQEVTNPKYGGRFPQSIKIEGVFKPLLE